MLLLLFCGSPLALMCLILSYHCYMPSHLPVRRLFSLQHVQSKGSTQRRPPNVPGATFRRSLVTDGQALKNTLKSSPFNKKNTTRSHILSEKLCDDILQVLSPFLAQHPPCDILDYCPGSGLLSAKVHDFLRPRRHILLEPNDNIYGTFLEPLVQRPSVKLVPLSLTACSSVNWKALFAEHLPKQTSAVNPYSLNNSLLVLANIAAKSLGSTHFTHARLWDQFMDLCLNRQGVHSYGTIRVLALLSSTDAELIVPRTVVGRKKSAMLTESVALHAFHVAENTFSNASRLGDKELELVSKSAARVRERTAEQSIPVPEGREGPPILMAPEALSSGRKPSVYVPRLRQEAHQPYLDILDNIKKLESRPKSSSVAAKLKETKRQLKLELSQLNFDNRHWCSKKLLCDQHTAIDQLGSSLFQAVVERNSDPENIKELDLRIAHLKAELASTRAKNPIRTNVGADFLIDERRAAFNTGSLDDSALLWDRRPIEPMRIKPDELHPNTKPCDIIYFQSNAESPVRQTLIQPEFSALPEFFGEIVSAFGARANSPVISMLKVMFPGRSTVDLVKSIPRLAKFASKRLRPDYNGSLKTPENEASSSSSDTSSIDDHQGRSEETESVSTASGYLEYDFSEVRLRSLPFPVLWDLAVEYFKSESRPESALLVNRALGGSITAFNSAIESFDFQAGKAAGKISHL
ncbi:hypothetical protein V8E54_007814 [Elaphomyces granulatus]